MAAVMFLVKWMFAFTETDVWTVQSTEKRSKRCVNVNIQSNSIISINVFSF